MDSYEQYGIQIPYGRTHGNVKCVCPNCRDGRGHPNDRSLSVNLDEKVWNCHHCGWTGRLKGDGEWKPEGRPRREYKRPQPRRLTDLSPKVVEWFNRRGISERTLRDMRISEGEEFLPQVGGKRNTIQFNYYLHGELVNIKFRDGAKNFKLCSGAELIPYNLDGIEGESECIITEGEMDALSFIEIGKRNVVSVPNGANANLSYLDDYVDGFFEDKEVIYIASDTDAKGKQLRDELIRRFGAERCRVVTYGRWKDANEVLQNEGKEALSNCLRSAADVPVSGICTVRDYEEDLDRIYEHGMRKGLGIGHANFDEICTFETGRLCVVAGVPGSGKSEFIDEICIRMNLLHGYKTAFFSPENMPLAYHATKLIEKLTGEKLEQRSMTRSEYEEAKEYVADNFFHIVPDKENTLTNILEPAKYLIRRNGIRILVIDPFNRVESEQGEQTETQYISDFLSRLASFAQRNDILLILMAHPRKMNRDKGKQLVPNLYDIGGSAHFFNKCDFGIVVDRDRETKVVNVNVEKVKFRNLGMGGVARFMFDLENGRYAPADEAGTEPTYDRRNYLRDGLKAVEPPAPETPREPDKRPGDRTGEEIPVTPVPSSDGTVTLSEYRKLEGSLKGRGVFDVISSGDPAKGNEAWNQEATDNGEVPF